MPLEIKAKSLEYCIEAVAATKKEVKEAMERPTKEAFQPSYRKRSGGLLFNFFLLQTISFVFNRFYQILYEKDEENGWW